LARSFKLLSELFGEFGLRFLYHRASGFSDLMGVSCPHFSHLGGELFAPLFHALVRLRGSRDVNELFQ
jgi:hypothetical protein